MLVVPVVVNVAVVANAVGGSAESLPQITRTTPVATVLNHDQAKLDADDSA